MAIDRLGEIVSGLSALNRSFVTALGTLTRIEKKTNTIATSNHKLNRVYISNIALSVAVVALTVAVVWKG